MDKNELALEILKLVSDRIGRNERRAANPNEDYAKAITDAYNYIYENIKTD